MHRSSVSGPIFSLSIARRSSMAKQHETPRPDPEEQSGSAGRDPGPPRDNPGQDGKPGTGDNTGQGNYGQSGYGKGRYDKGGPKQSNYQEDPPGREHPDSQDSNRGSGKEDPA
jgi:hypothetical protein